MEFRIQDDRNRDQVLFPEYKDEGMERGELVAMGFLENGTAAGRPALVGLLKLPDGTFVDFQMTANMYLTIAAGMKGAMARWGTPWEGA